METKKLTVTWAPNIEQELDYLCSNPKSIIHEKELTECLIEKYGSIENFKILKNVRRQD